MCNAMDVASRHVCHPQQCKSTQVFSQIEALLEQAGSSRGHMLHVLVHLRSMADGLQEFNAAWRAWLGDDEASLPVLCVKVFYLFAL